jgi:hypothetical protein
MRQSPRNGMIAGYGMAHPSQTEDPFPTMGSFERAERLRLQN